MFCYVKLSTIECFCFNLPEINYFGKQGQYLQLLGPVSRKEDGKLYEGQTMLSNISEAFWCFCCGHNQMVNINKGKEQRESQTLSISAGKLHQTSSKEINIPFFPHLVLYCFGGRTGGYRHMHSRSQDISGEVFAC